VKRHKESAAHAPSVEPGHKLPAAGLTGELTAILEACSQRLLELQEEAAAIVFSEAAAIQAAWLRAVTSLTEMLPQDADRANTARLIAIVNGWFRVMTQAQTAMVELIGKSATAGARLPATQAPASWPNSSERRRLAVVINFPDRRRAA